MKQAIQSRQFHVAHFCRSGQGFAVRKKYFHTASKDHAKVHPVSAKKALIRFGSLKTLAAQSRNTAQFCGFFVYASFFGGLNGEPQGSPVNGLRQCPGLPTCSSCHPRLEAGVTVSQPTHWRPIMAQTLAFGALAKKPVSTQPAPTSGSQGEFSQHSRFTTAESVLRAILAEVTPGQRPYSGDSYLPGHLVDAAQAALAGTDQAARQHAHNALSTAAWHIARGEAPQALARMRRAQSHILASMTTTSGRAV